MKNTTLLIIAPGAAASTIEATLKGTDFRKVGDYVWFVHADETAVDLQNTIRNALGANGYFFTLDRAAIQNGYVPNTDAGWFGAARAA